MHLSDRSRSMGLTLDIDEDLEQGTAERLFNLWQELVEGNRRHLAV